MTNNRAAAFGGDVEMVRGDAPRDVDKSVETTRRTAAATATWISPRRRNDAAAFDVPVKRRAAGTSGATAYRIYG